MSKFKKISILLGSCGVIFGTYLLWQYKLEVPVNEDTIGKNVVKNSKVIQEENDRQIKSVQGTVRDSNDIKILLRNKYSSSFGESSTVEWKDNLNLYEVVNGLQVLYITGNGKNVISGHVYDLQTGLDYTEVKLAEISRINPKDLPLNKFIKITNGDGSRVIYVFSYLDDQFKDYYNKTLSNINNASIYVLLNQATPSDNDDDYIKTYKSKLFRSIYCSDDSERELKNFLKPAKWNPLTNIVDNCNQKIKDDDISGIFEKYKIVWSPTIFLGNGYRYKALPDYQINQLLSKVNESSPDINKVANGVSGQLGVIDKKTPSNSNQVKTGMGSGT